MTGSHSEKKVMARVCVAEKGGQSSDLRGIAGLKSDRNKGFMGRIKVKLLSPPPFLFSLSPLPPPPFFLYFACVSQFGVVVSGHTAKCSAHGSWCRSCSSRRERQVHCRPNQIDVSHDPEDFGQDNWSQ